MKGIERNRPVIAVAIVLLGVACFFAVPTAAAADDLGSVLRQSVGWVGRWLRRAPVKPATAPAVVPAGMVFVAGGRFHMGDAFGEGAADERPVRECVVASFFMDRTEVSLALWNRVSTWSDVRGYDLVFAGATGVASNHPVHYVSWYDCVKWCNARSELEGLTPCYTVGGETYKVGEGEPVSNHAADGYRLPSEMEWEYAARGGTTGRRFPWDGADDIEHERANFRAGESPDHVGGTPQGYHPRYNDGTMPYTSPVGAFAPNGYGLHDMAGNVWEWCWDWYDSGAYAVAEARSWGPPTGKTRVLRGGSWYDPAFKCRVTSRNSLNPRGSGSDLGFRTVRPLPQRNESVGE